MVADRKKNSFHIVEHLGFFLKDSCDPLAAHEIPYRSIWVLYDICEKFYQIGVKL